MSCCNSYEQTYSILCLISPAVQFKARSEGSVNKNRPITTRYHENVAVCALCDFFAENHPNFEVVVDAEVPGLGENWWRKQSWKCHPQTVIYTPHTTIIC